MFVEIQSMLEKDGSALVMNVVKVGSELCVTVTPKGTWENKALSVGLTLKGTAQELDASLPAQLVQYTNARQSLQDQISSTLLVIEAATKEAKEKASAAIKKSASAAPAKAVTAATPTVAVPVQQANASEQEHGTDVINLF